MCQSRCCENNRNRSGFFFFVVSFFHYLCIERSKYFCALNCRNVGVGREREQVGETKREDGRTKQTTKMRKNEKNAKNQIRKMNKRRNEH